MDIPRELAFALVILVMGVLYRYSIFRDKEPLGWNYILSGSMFLVISSALGFVDWNLILKGKDIDRWLSFVVSIIAFVLIVVGALLFSYSLLTSDEEVVTEE